MAATVVLADDQSVARAGVRAWLTDSPIEIVGEAANAPEAERLTLNQKPGVLLIEVRLAGGDGLECLRRLRASGDETPTLFFTSQTNPTYAARAAALGASGMLAKTVGREELVETLLRVADGRRVWSTQALRRFSGPLAPADLDAANEAIAGVALTVRESEVLKQLAFGLSNKEIAAALGISYETAKEHVQHILRKLGVADRTQAAVWAVRQGVA